MGVSQQRVREVLGTAVCRDEEGLSLELFTDASKSWGVGGVFGPDTFPMRWEREVSEDHIGALELEALYRSLHHRRESCAAAPFCAGVTTHKQWWQ